MQRDRLVPREINTSHKAEPTSHSGGIDLMNSQGFPAFVCRLPEADLPFAGLKGWLLQSESGQLLFNESAVEVSIPEHSHGDQWGVVIDGQIELTIGGQTRTYRNGETYFIPADVPHRAHIHPGFRAVDYFADKDRYRACHSSA